MPQWYCGVQGNQYGPVDDATIRAWISQGRIGATSPVWCEGMSEWRPAAEQFPDMFPGGTAGFGSQGAAGPGLTLVPPPGGTDGATPNSQLVADARRLLRGRWGLPIGVCLLGWLIVGASGIIPYVGPLIFAGPIYTGVAAFFLTFARGGKGDLGMLFAGFKCFGTALGAYLLTILLFFAWFLLGCLPAFLVFIAAAATEEPAIAIFGALLILPGYVLPIVKSLGYSQALYVIADDSGVGAWGAIERSVQLMRGRKGKFFLLGLRFAAWILLAFVPGLLITLLGAATEEPLAIVPGIMLMYFGPLVLMIWLMPYMFTSYARFYDDLQPPGRVQAQAMVGARL